MAGKDVVQLYYTAPYKAGQIEKSYVALGAYEKTALLQPGESDIVTLSLPVESMANPVCRQFITSLWSPKMDMACVPTVRDAT